MFIFPARYCLTMTLATVVLGCHGEPAVAPVSAPPTAPSATDLRDIRVAAASEEADRRRAAHVKAFLAAADDDQRAALSRDFVDFWTKTIDEMLSHALAEPSSTAAREAALWIVMHADADDDAHIKATELLLAHHRLTDALAPAYARLNGYHPVYERLLRAGANEHANRAARGLATFQLAALLVQRAEYRELMSLTPDSDAARRENLGEAIVDHLESCAPKQDRAEAMRLFHAARDSYGDIAHRNTTLAWAAAERLMPLEQTYPEIGREAPEIAGTDLEEDELKLSDLRGRVVVIVFWASWCGPCIDRIPEENQLAADFRGEAFALVGVSGDRTRAAALDAARQHSIGFASWWDDPSAPSTIVARYGITAWPTTYVLDGSGVIRFKNLSGEALRTAIEKLLAEEKLSQKESGAGE